MGNLILPEINKKMKKLLVINSSPREGRSHSRRLTDVFTNHWKEHNATGSIVYRDLAKSGIPHVNESWIAGAFKHQDNRTAEEIDALKISGELIGELKQADVIVLGAPMHNWSITSTLKAYIDQIIRINETWELNTENLKSPYIGLMKGKTLILLISRGATGYELGEYNAHMNFQTPYLRTVFNIMGITDIHEVALNGEGLGPDAFEISIKNSHLKIQELIETHLI